MDSIIIKRLKSAVRIYAIISIMLFTTLIAAFINKDIGITLLSSHYAIIDALREVHDKCIGVKND